MLVLVDNFSPWVAKWSSMQSLQYALLQYGHGGFLVYGMRRVKMRLSIAGFP